MLKIIGRRLLEAVPTLGIIIVASFLMMRLAPGGPFDMERSLPPEIEAELRAAYDLDAPMLLQLGRYVGGLAQGDFGPSFSYLDYSVGELIAAGLPVSATIGGLALLAALGFGILAGTAAAVSSRGEAVNGAALLLLSIPVFVLAPILSLTVGVHLGWLPVSGWGGGASAHVILPVFTLALPTAAAVARIVRNSLKDALDSPNILFARAKGASEARVLLIHALPQALRPVASFAGPAAAALMTGSVVIEKIFALPGLGRYFVEGALARDYPLVLGVVIVYAALVILFNLVADLVLLLLDPRLRDG